MTSGVESHLSQVRLRCNINRCMLATFGMAASVDKRTQEVPVGTRAIENHLVCANDIPARWCDHETWGRTSQGTLLAFHMLPKSPAKIRIYRPLVDISISQSGLPLRSCS